MIYWLKKQLFHRVVERDWGADAAAPCGKQTRLHKRSGSFRLLSLHSRSEVAHREGQPVKTREGKPSKNPNACGSTLRETNPSTFWQGCAGPSKAFALTSPTPFIRRGPTPANKTTYAVRQLLQLSSKEKKWGSDASSAWALGPQPPILQ